ncbi:acetoacetyl-CoA reductase [Legionella micdadei]|uniref:3-oxoacyl-[acyl-carrier-protein] reductase n=1 Tax=Legionella micdadei TaxID=451 RepID=A0A098GB07_LEGMI|nr:acetoacetyl-CoA reductase [Legionella micdadei]ARG96458.1 beta-ketoacyl-ACP reductase [Legionella micdadei]ARG99208.1 beta-ketoacyl-ACP reductase [Legionella micdadei]KTD29450.1 3-oxoacyl-ACP reductase [Legionella micdadei]NSL18152.1 acetoacetyl-CoA reductase [Legionella micdadei]CEG59668.1 Acetoacetyl-CoA reductase [Legionella micdadei]
MQKDKIALITGGTGDIGTAIVKQLNPLYGKVIALDVVPGDKAALWQSELHQHGFQQSLFRRMDVTDFDQCKVVIDSIIQEFGRIDVLVNNAGITRDAVFNKMTKEQWDDVLRVNLDGMFNVTRHVVDCMRRQESGRIINISSVNAQKGQYSQANYAASKAGIYGFTKSLAQELMAKNITVNSISPGYVNTRLMQGIRPDILKSIIELIPAKRLAEPEEIAWVVEFLVNDNSRYITGANLSINGGLHMY